MRARNPQGLNRQRISLGPEPTSQQCSEINLRRRRRLGVRFDAPVHPRNHPLHFLSDPAVEKSNAAFDGYFAKEKYKSFEMQLRDANDKYKAAGAVCRE